MSTPNTTLSYRLEAYIGSGGFSRVYKAVEVDTGKTVAIKKSRVSQRVKRTHLRYEGRVLHLLQGHPAIPAIYGYGHLRHFEHLAIELLGLDVMKRRSADTARLSVKTAVHIVQQVLSALQHVHTSGFVHRDIKPENILCSTIDDSKIMLVDFGIARRFKPALSQPPPSKSFVGTVKWAGLNAHDGIGEYANLLHLPDILTWSLTELAPRDDLESLAYSALFLLNGHLPWFRYHSSMKPIRTLKASLSRDSLPSLVIPSEFWTLSEHSRSLKYHEMPDYAMLQNVFDALAQRVGCVPGEALEWTSTSFFDASTEAPAPDDEDKVDEDGDEANGDATSNEEFSDSFSGYEYPWSTLHNARDRDLMLGKEETESADSCIPEIIHVSENLK